MVASLTFFLLLSGDTYKRKLVRLSGPMMGNKKIAVHILDDINDSIQRYMFMLFATNLLVGLLTWGGFTIVTQMTSFIQFLQRVISTLPETINTLSQQSFVILGFTFNLAQYDINQLINPLLGSVEPILTSLGGMVAKFAGGAAEVIGWIAFLLLVSYFILYETRGKSGRLINFDLPGYANDINLMGTELGKIWNAFLRGQILIVLITIVVYSILLSILGLRFAFGLAILAGLARFVPYVGPAVAWTTLGLVAYFQQANYFNLSPIVYALMCVGIAWFADAILDNFVATRILARTLKIHPAAVLVMAFIGANLIGLVGVVLASPVMASVKLFSRYLVRKLFDQDPWEGLDRIEVSRDELRWMKALKRIWRKFLGLFQKKSTQTK
jgi:predicted PurR-regulated permease PerM